MSEQYIILKNKRQFKKWAKDACFEGYLTIKLEEAEDCGYQRKDLKERQDGWYSHNGPKEYPCVAQSVCTSCNYEESAPQYLYAADLRGFLKAMGHD